MLSLYLHHKAISREQEGLHVFSQSRAIEVAAVMTIGVTSKKIPETLLPSDGSWVYDANLFACLIIVDKIDPKNKKNKVDFQKWSCIWFEYDILQSGGL